MKIKRILLVDDTAADVENVEHAIRKLKIPFELRIARSVQEAIDILTGNIDEKITPDIILVDADPVGLSGFEFLRIIKNYYSLSRIKRYLMSSFYEETEELTAKKLGADGYIVKPLTNNKVKGDMRKLLEELRS
jgi:CheY-like chemotaxis protein